MKKINSNSIQKISAIVLGLVLSVGASYVSAVARPSSINTTGPVVINASLSSQNKSGSISVKSLLVGNYANNTSSNTVAVDSTGKMAVGRRAPTSGISLDVKGTSGILGTLRSKAISYNGSTGDLRPVCVSEDGLLGLCSTVEFNVIPGQNGAPDSTNYTYYIVPPGVSSLEVEVYGGGGAGWSLENGDGSGDDGDTSFIRNGNINITANGGQGAVEHSKSVGGLGGTASSSVSGATVTNGENGGGLNILNSSMPTVISSVTCTGTTYYKVRGGVGQPGALGGKAGPGSRASGGSQGDGDYMASTEYSGPGFSWSFLTGNPCSAAGSTSAQQLNLAGASSRILDRLGGTGSDGVLGGGGGGGGSNGGLSALADSSDCSSVDSENCKGSSTFGNGGGAGGYVKATLAVAGGDVLYIKVGKGGVAPTIYCGGNNQPSCFSIPSVGGNGGNGYIKITIK